MQHIVSRIQTILLLFLIYILAGCAPKISFSVLKPPVIDIGPVKKIAVMDFEFKGSWKFWHQNEELTLKNLALTALAKQLGVANGTSAPPNPLTAFPGNEVSAKLIASFLQNGHFEVLERTHLEKLLGEQNLTLTGVMDESQAVKVGKLLVDVINPDVGMSAVQLIEREGVKIIYPQDQTCCGQPPFNSGYREEARKVALQQVKLFFKDIPIVVPSGSCSAMMKHHYLELFQDHEDLEKVRQFSTRIIELSQFLVHVLQIKLEDKGPPIDLTWHASCHALREMHVKEEPKQLLRQLKNVNLVELKNEHECCGFGGTFSIKYSAISEAMVDDKIKDIEDTNSSKVLSGDCGCLMQIEGRIKYQNKPIQGQHLASFLWERTNA